ncbi:MAG: acyl-ACP--UDP-N-acetylglucosamine O-acyltransferase [Phycisphaerales bacterium]|nr:acyl-ACP--UDP-N-acetylglucosamine O-acyltransferase [Phycisphaerales bacterium]
MIHPHALVDKDAKIGNNVIIEPFSVIHKDVEIGDGTYIASNTTIMSGSRIGSNCEIFNNSVIGGIPQDLKYKGEYTTVEIGSHTKIREFVTVNRGTEHRGKTKIGSNCLLMAYSHIAHDCIIGNNCILSNSTQMAGHVVLGDFAIVAGVCAIHQFVTIGRHVYVAGGSLVNKDIPPFIKTLRNPISYGGVNSVGLKRRDFTNTQINQILDIYRILFNQGLNTSQALTYLEGDFEASDVKDEIVEFIKTSGSAGRGIIKGNSKNAISED